MLLRNQKVHHLHRKSQLHDTILSLFSLHQDQLHCYARHLTPSLTSGLFAWGLQTKILLRYFVSSISALTNCKFPAIFPQYPSCQIGQNTERNVTDILLKKLTYTHDDDDDDDSFHESRDERTWLKPHFDITKPR